MDSNSNNLDETTRNVAELNAYSDNSDRNDDDSFDENCDLDFQ